MISYFTDFALFAIFVIGLTATMGVLANGIGSGLFGGKTKNAFYEQSSKTQKGWNPVKRK
ncbi:hypothetical protein J9317_06385 [Metabacillus sp. KIGAM252]|uniref:Uncharacterized protein n=1 Tax=Metabacillus flavus TaxID=2823519 RepID=A0ABS5LCD0_9BACI|nr:hypothetical protein [Metabacillus flavus]MBS2968385.1 hypothetical protein [Metabacillus flavus]